MQARSKALQINNKLSKKSRKDYAIANERIWKAIAFWNCDESQDADLIEKDEISAALFKFYETGPFATKYTNLHQIQSYTKYTNFDFKEAEVSNPDIILSDKIGSTPLTT